jgi:hypothetical protein
MLLCCLLYICHITLQIYHQQELAYAWRINGMCMLLRMKVSVRAINVFTIK